jgi:hypothetical protein
MVIEILNSKSLKNLIELSFMFTFNVGPISDVSLVEISKNCKNLNLNYCEK